MNRRCRHAWLCWLASSALVFSYLELRGYKHRCHPTLSRELQAWTKPLGRNGPWVFAVAGAALSWHLYVLKELPIKQETP